MEESWDLDDIVVPASFSVLHLTRSTSDADTETESSSAGASALFSGADELDWEHEEKEQKLSPPNAEASNTVSSTDSSSKNSTLKGIAASLADTPKPSKDRTPTTTLRVSSSVSALLSSVTAGPGKVTHLGSTPRGQAKSVTGDWDEDIEFALPKDLGARPLRSKSSFSSHISDDLEDDALEPPRQAHASRGSKASDNVEEIDESDFDLPEDLSKISLSPLLNRRASTSLTSTLEKSESLSEVGGTEINFEPTIGNTPEKPRTMITAPSSRGGDTSAESEFEDDDAFFSEIVLPSYFLHSSASDKGKSPEPAQRVDLQAILRTKLAARGEIFPTSPTSSASDKKLDGFREKDEELEHGLEIGPEVKLGEERMRTRSVPLKPHLKKSNSPAFPNRAPPARSISLSTNNTTITAASPPRKSRPPTTTSTRPSAMNLGLGRPSSRPASAQSNDRPPITNMRITGTNASNTGSLREKSRSRTGSVTSVLSANSTIKRPSKIDTTLAVAAASSNVNSPSTPSATSNRLRTLSTKKSQGNLLGTPTPRTLERKRSLQNLTSSNALELPHQFATVRQTIRTPTPPVRSIHSSVSPQKATTPLASNSSFARPTASSVSRIRERVASGPTQPDRFPRSTTLATRPGSALSTRPPSQARPLPTKARLQATRSPSGPLDGIALSSSIPLTLSKPKRGQHYGDGTELDGFDDLPTSKDREKRVALSRRSTSTPVRNSTTTSLSSPSKKAPVPANKLARPGSGLRNHNSTDRSDSPNRLLRKLVETPTKSPRKAQSMPTPDTKKKKKEPKKPIHLIKNMGSSPKKQGDMVWNPTLQRWEGNEGVLKDFDKILATSSRPALITPLSMGSPARHVFNSLPASKIPHLRSNIRVVGSMVFDPIKMSWYSMESEEDELDLTMADLADDEAEDGWERGEHDRMLKNRASFMSEGSRDGSEVDDESHKNLWRESVEAERKHREEVENWTISALELGVLPDRKFLYSLRALINDSN